MEARRIRLILSGTILQPDLAYRFHLSTAPRSLELMDFYFNWRINRQLQFRYGQYKVPFTRYRIQSFQRLTFADWAIVTRYFGAERQTGFTVHNGYEKPPEYGYVFGVFTGVNARASHAVGLAEFYDEEVSNPSDLADPGPRQEFHPEFFLYVAFRTKGMDIQSDSDRERGALQYNVGMSVSWDLDPMPRKDFSLRLSPEMLVKYRGASAMGAGYAGFLKIDDQASIDLAMLGGLFQAAYRVSCRHEVSARYSIVDFRDIIINDAADWAVESAAERAFREEEITVGINWYLMEHTLKWQNDAGWLRHSRTSGLRNDFVTRSQFQVAF